MSLHPKNEGLPPPRRVLLINQADPASNGEWFTDTDVEVCVPGSVAAPEEEIEKIDIRRRDFCDGPASSR